MIQTKVILKATLAMTALWSLITLTNSRTSTRWKLNSATGKIQFHDTGAKNKGSYFADNKTINDLDLTSDIYQQDAVFYIIATSNRIFDGVDWSQQSLEPSILHSPIQMSIGRKISTESFSSNLTAEQRMEHAHNEKVVKTRLKIKESLDCGQLLNYTQYDYITNIGDHYRHKEMKLMPEPEVAYFFLRNHDKHAYKNFNLAALEAHLKQAKLDNPHSAKVYHHIGNYWRIVGDAIEAVKCFRRALDISPTESEIMFNLGKVLYNLQYLDDAIYMTRSPAHTVWPQYYMLGEILKTYGDIQGSLHYYRLALELNPTHELIVKALRDIDNKPTAGIHTYTVVIIITLVIAVLSVIVTCSVLDDHRGNVDGRVSIVSNQRSFHRNMRSLKGFSTARNNRLRRFRINI
ncbi:uncharacterized protein LOC119637348 isoform X2 [Glossina fuscipes]|uniref:Uncharacterized protein LOC119637348 isoform X2 n=1 Tax=Glossina fuscipes TaxID=7396 RepID=A0A9C6DS57_9MUSC|nr:uncharacterized protein LOC119637348 isoform X2 [Glossina fuscipes]